MVSRAARNLAVFIVPIAIASLLLSLALEEENPRVSKALQVLGVAVPSIILTASAFLPEEVSA